MSLFVANGVIGSTCILAFSCLLGDGVTEGERAGLSKRGFVSRLWNMGFVVECFVTSLVLS